jgi:transcriptional regulator GlxA family with amidase domain
VAGVSPSHLRALFHRHLAVSPSEHQVRLRLDLAAKLLRSSYLSMAEVAAAVGWQDANYFARRFAQFHGKRPRAWRQEHRA